MRTKILSILATLLLIIAGKANAQNDLTIYPMQIIPQSFYSNPALIPTCRLHFGFPALSSMYISGNHTGFNPKHVLSVNPLDSVEINMESMIDHLGKMNYLNVNFNEEILSFGFRLKKVNYINFSLTERMFARVGYPKDLINFIYRGNGAFLGEKMDIGGLYINATHYREFAFGYAREMNRKWTVGARAKLLFGMANVWTKDLDVSLTTDPAFFDITAQSNIGIYASLPAAVWDTSENAPSVEAGDYLMNFKNMGVGVDLGATYRYNDKLTLGASVLDLGFIHWGNQDDVRNFVSREANASFTYSGVDIAEFLSDEDSIARQKLESFVDSVVGIFKIDTLQNAYSSPLNTRLHLSAFYELTPKDRATALVRLDIYNNAIHPMGYLSYSRKFGNILNLTGSYSIGNRNYTNLGLGIALNLGPVQWYFITDNVLSPIFYGKYTWTEENGDQSNLILPRNMKYMNVHWGINIAFGCKPPKETAPVID